MASKGEQTRTLILDTAQALILDHGYAGVSIDQIIRQLEVTKGAFFHHFKNKNELGRALIRRYATNNVELLENHLARARKLSDDPLQQFLIFVGLYEEMFEELSEPFPGCLIASYVYELQQFDDDVKPIVNEEFLLSRKELTALIDRIAKKYPPRLPIDTSALADNFMAVFEGAFILSKSLDESEITVKQLGLYKKFISLLFSSSSPD